LIDDGTFDFNEYEFEYMACDGTIVTTNFVNQSRQLVCAVENSIVPIDDVNYLLTPNGVCGSRCAPQPTPSATRPSYYLFRSCFANPETNKFDLIFQTQPLEFNLEIDRVINDPVNGNCWRYLGPAPLIYYSEITETIVWSGNYFAGGSSFSYATCEECTVLSTKINLRFQVEESFNGYIPYRATTTFNSPNFGVSFYSGDDPNDGILIYPNQDIINDGQYVAQLVTLNGANPFIITRLAVGFIYGRIEEEATIIAKIYINNELVSQKSQVLNASDEDFGVQLDGLFEQITCLDNPCIRDLNTGDILLIKLETLT
jgi:hypothetical protein